MRLPGWFRRLISREPEPPPPPPDRQPDDEEEDRLGAYLRESQANARGIQAQAEALEKAFPGQISAGYMDDGVSGDVQWMNRQGLSQLIFAIQSSTLSGIAITTLDRLSRSMLDQEAILALIWEHGGRVASIREGEILPDSPGSEERKIIRLGIAYQNQQLLLANRERRLRGRQRRLDSRHFNGGVPYGGRQYGYDLYEWWDPARRQWRQDWLPREDEMKIVWEIHDELSGKHAGFEAKARELNARGVPTVTGAPWGRKVVERIAKRKEFASRYEPEIIELSDRRARASTQRPQTQSRAKAIS